MASDLLLIGKSGAMAARAALDLTAQNIANSNNPDYARRTLSLAEVASRGGIGLEWAGSLSGVRPDSVLRSNSLFLHYEARRTASDLARAEAELIGLTSAETAIEQAGIYPAIVEFEASLSRLSADPLNGPMRAAVLEQARTLAQSFQIANSGLDAAAADQQFTAQAGVDQANLLAAELARTNVAIARTQPGSGSMAVLHDQRDALLRDLTGLTGAQASFDSLGRVNVTLDGQSLVTGSQAAVLAMTVNPDGSFAFSLGGGAVAPTSGSLAGQSQAAAAIGVLRGQLDALAGQVVTLANSAQASGVAIDGTPGQPLFSGNGAADIALALSSGAGIATAPAGAGAGSRDISNLQALRDALASGGPAQGADALLFGLSSTISARSITRDALRTIAQTADAALSAETGVDLDTEATNLLRFQQAFEANGKVMQVAADIFDTILGIG